MYTSYRQVRFLYWLQTSGASPPPQTLSVAISYRPHHVNINTNLRPNIIPTFPPPSEVSLCPNRSTSRRLCICTLSKEIPSHRTLKEKKYIFSPFSWAKLGTQRPRLLITTPTRSWILATNLQRHTASLFFVAVSHF